MHKKYVKQHPTLPVKCHEKNGMVCRTEGKNAGVWTRGSLHVSGYYKIRIGSKIHWVHRLIAETFIPNPENKPTVDHWNRNKADNRVSNLRWATYKEQAHNVSRLVADYGVSRTEDPAGYFKAYRESNRKKINERRRKYRAWMKMQCEFYHW